MFFDNSSKIYIISRINKKSCYFSHITENTDVVIIGAGPVGLFAVFELGLLNIECQLVDNLDKVGGQCAELYPEKPIYDIPSRPVVTGQELTDELISQIEPFKPKFHLSQQVDKITKSKTGWIVETSIGTIIEAKCVVVAAGAGSFVPRKLPIENIDQLHKVLGLKFRRILFDNVSPSKLKKYLKICNNKYETEYSGNANLNNIKKISMTGVDRISVGSITHSAKSFDSSLLIF